MKAALVWLRWLFRRGAKNTLKLNMHPADSVVAMCSHRDMIVVASKAGEMYYFAAGRRRPSNGVARMTALHSAAHLARHAPAFQRAHRQRRFARAVVYVYLSLLVLSILGGILHAY